MASAAGAQDIRAKAGFGEGDGPQLAVILDQYAGLVSRTERLLLARVKAGQASSVVLARSRPVGGTPRHGYRLLQAKLSSVKELAQARSEDVRQKIKSKKIGVFVLNG